MLLAENLSGNKFGGLFIVFLAIVATLFAIRVAAATVLLLAASRIREALGGPAVKIKGVLQTAVVSAIVGIALFFALKGIFPSDEARLSTGPVVLMTIEALIMIPVIRRLLPSDLRGSVILTLALHLTLLAIYSSMIGIVKLAEHRPEQESRVDQGDAESSVIEIHTQKNGQPASSDVEKISSN